MESVNEDFTSSSITRVYTISMNMLKAVEGLIFHQCMLGIWKLYDCISLLELSFAQLLFQVGLCPPVSMSRLSAGGGEAKSQTEGTNGGGRIRRRTFGAGIVGGAAALPSLMELPGIPSRSATTLLLACAKFHLPQDSLSSSDNPVLDWYHLFLMLPKYIY